MEIIRRSNSTVDSQKHGATSESFVFRQRRIPSLTHLENMLKAFSPFERMVLYLFSLLMGVGVFIMMAQINISLTEVVPSYGGQLREGIVGAPRFANPLLAISDADRDVVALVYSGLMRATPEDTFIPDLAEQVALSEDGLTYTFILRADAFFQDGEPVTAEDVAFTIAMAQNQDVKSPRRTDWEGVVVHAVDTRVVTITLPHPYAPFMENTTLGILPKHLWQDIQPSEFAFHKLNTNPLGSGPYRLTNTKLDSTGTPQRYTFKASSDYTLGKPFISTIRLNFFPNEDDLFDALSRGDIESTSGVAPDRMSQLPIGTHFVRAPLPRIFAVFLNQNKAPMFADDALRRALSNALDRSAIIEDNLQGYGVAVEGPLLPDMLQKNLVNHYAGDATSSSRTTRNSEETDKSMGPSLKKEAIKLLEESGWKLDSSGIRVKKGVRLSFSIATADTPELAGSADSVARIWRELGADVSVKVFSTSDLTNAVIRPRDYQALLFGEVVGRSLDLFAFWHSSQRNDPGLNIALYANVKTDKLLSDARKDASVRNRLDTLRTFAGIIRTENPAIFLYAPEFIYVIPKDVSGIKLGSLTTPSERFLNIREWHLETERVWSMFTEPISNLSITN